MKRRKGVSGANVGGDGHFKSLYHKSPQSHGFPYRTAPSILRFHAFKCDNSKIFLNQLSAITSVEIIFEIQFAASNIDVHV